MHVACFLVWFVLCDDEGLVSPSVPHLMRDGRREGGQHVNARDGGGERSVAAGTRCAHAGSPLKSVWGM